MLKICEYNAAAAISCRALAVERKPCGEWRWHAPRSALLHYMSCVAALTCSKARSTEMASNCPSVARRYLCLPSLVTLIKETLDHLSAACICKESGDPVEAAKTGPVRIQLMATRDRRTVARAEGRRWTMLEHVRCTPNSCRLCCMPSRQPWATSRHWGSRSV